MIIVPLTWMDNEKRETDLMKKIAWLASTILLLLSHTTSFAADRYRIEIVVAKQRNASGQGGINWSEQLLAPRFSRVLSLKSGAARAAERGFERVEPSALRSAANKLEQSGRYTVLSHIAWEQPAQSKEGAWAIQIAAGNEIPVYPSAVPIKNNRSTSAIAVTPDPAMASSDQLIRNFSLNGTIKVHVGRFLHINSQLIYTDSDLSRSAVITGKRRMRSKEIHYLDNPLIGILAIATPIE